MLTVHLVYPHGPSISCPDAIGRKVGEGLSPQYNVVYHDWDAPYAIKPGPYSVLLGHPHPYPWTCFRRSMRQPGWHRVIIMSPYNHDQTQVAFLDSIIRHCDLYLAITGNYWFNSVAQSAFAHWQPKMRHLDLAVDRYDFPSVKKRFNPPGHRKFVYIGHSGWQKNTRYLSQIAREMPDVQFSWVGSGKRLLPGFTTLGRQDFRMQSAKDLMGLHDFLITAGRADANPTTILEAMAWGLVPVCTPQSGYVGYPGIVNIPLDDVRSAVEMLRKLEALPEAELVQMQRMNWAILDTHFNWGRFVDQVMNAIEAADSPMLGEETLGHKLRLGLAAMVSPYSWLRPRGLKSILQRL